MARPLPLLVTLIALVAVAGSGAGAGGARVSVPPHHRHWITVARTLHLSAGASRAKFEFTIHAQFPDDVVLVVPHGSRVRLVAMSANRGQGISGSSTPSWGPCPHRGGLDVCEQGQEWCGLIPGRWTAVVWKTSMQPAVVRVRLVFVSGVRES